MKFILILNVIYLYYAAVEGIAEYYMDQLCGSTLEMQGPHTIYTLRLKLTKDSYYDANMNCYFHIFAGGNEKLMLYFKSMDIFDDCLNYWLELHDGASRYDHFVPGLQGKQCGSSSKLWKVYHTNTNAMTLFFSAARIVHYNDFDMIITRYHNGHCTDNEYRCDNGRCINKSLQCNDYNPCGDHSDCHLVAGSVAAIVMGSGAFLVMMITCIVFVRRRRKKIYRERIVTVQTPSNYGTPAAGFNQPTPQQYPAQPHPTSPPATYQGGYEPVPSAPPPPYSK